MSFTRFLLRTSCVLTLFVGAINSVNAQQLTDANNDLLATQSGDSLLDANAQLLFTINAQGTVYNAVGELAGNFDSQGNIFDVNADKIGELANDGKVYDLNGDQLGQLNNNGSITDANTDTIAFFTNITHQKLAWYQFFQSTGIDF